MIKNETFIRKKWIKIIENLLNPYEKLITIKFILKNLKLFFNKKSNNNKRIYKIQNCIN